jgi:thymidylate kinase
MTNLRNSKRASDATTLTWQRCLSQADFLCTLFRLLDGHGIRYCVLHSWEGLPENLPSDLDLAVHPTDVGKLSFIFADLREKGYKPVQCLNYFVNAYYFVFFWLEGSETKYVAVDMIFEHRRSGLIVPSGEALVAGRRKKDIFWVPDPATEFAYLLAKNTWKGAAPPRRAQRLKLLVAELGSAQSERIAGELFGRRLNRQVVQACASGQVSELLGRIRTQPWWTSLARNPLKLVAYLLADGLRRIRRWFQPSGLLIAIFGPDGVGKSTLAAELSELFSPAFRTCRVFHWRPGLLKGSSTAVTRPHDQAPRGSFASAAHALGFALDYWLGFALVVRPLLARSGLVIFDRYFYDLLVDPRRYRYGGPLWLARVLSAFIPKPNLILFLDAPEEVVLSRKREVASEEVSRQRGSYLRKAKELPRARVIDATLPLLQVRARAGQVVTEYLAQRFESRHGVAWLRIAVARAHVATGS